MPHEKHKLDIVNTTWNQGLLTLATNTVLQMGTVPNVTQNFQPALYQGTIGLEDWTETDGPIELVVADGDLSLAEVQECLLAEPLHGRDQPALEQSRRPVQRLAALGSDHQSLQISEGNRLPMFRENVGWEFYVLNVGTALVTGASCVGAIATFGRWKD